MPNSRDPIGGAFAGALGGLALAFVAIIVGIIRAGRFLLSGGDLATPALQDAIGLAYYVSGFVVGGTVVGVLGAFFSSPRSTYVRFAAGGVIAMLYIVVHEEGGLAELEAFHWTLILGLGSVFGLAFAHGWLGRT